MLPFEISSKRAKKVLIQKRRQQNGRGDIGRLRVFLPKASALHQKLDLVLMLLELAMQARKRLLTVALSDQGHEFSAGGLIGFEDSA